MADELVQVALAVRDEPDPDTPRAEVAEHRQRVFVQREVLVPLPLPHHVDRARACAGRVRAHAEHDLLGERDPDLLVVHEVALAAELLDRGRAGVGVAAGIEREPVPFPHAPVPLGPELRPGPEQREVDVEENRAQHVVEDRANPARRRRTNAASFGAAPSAAGAGLCPAGGHARSIRAETRKGGTRGETSFPPAIREGGHAGGKSFPPANDRGAQIRTGDLSDPNGARYQAAPHPERGKGSGSAAPRPLRTRGRGQYAEVVMEALARRAD